MKPKLLLPFFLFTATALSQYVVDVQVVDLQVSVFDKKGDFLTGLKAEDFLVWEDGVAQEVLDVQTDREPFSIGVLLDTSFSMRPHFQTAMRGTQDFLYSLREQDEFFLMTFDDRLLLKKDLTLASEGKSAQWEDLKYGEETRLYDAVLSALQRLRNARYPRRALFLISDGINTSGSGDLKAAIELAQKEKAIIYGLMFDNENLDQNVLRQLADATGGSYFILYENLPRLQAAYEKIASDLAHRFTLYYRSRSDYARPNKPQIKVQMRNADLRVRYQKTYYPSK
jgi:VWFA-related protein